MPAETLVSQLEPKELVLSGSTSWLALAVLNMEELVNKCILSFLK